MSTPDFQVRDVPEYRCQLDSCCFEPRTGSLLWSESHLELKVGILERRNFRGAWANGNTIGLLDFSTGTVLTLSQERNTFGVPVHAGERCYFPWFANKDKCVGYVETGVELSIESQYGWPEKGVRDVTVWPFASGVGLQLNNQKMLWTQSGELKWIQRAKPYIYKVFATDESDIFVATDGNGGRLLGFSRDDGSETFNFRPAIGGVGSARYVSEVKCIVANVAMKKSYDTAPKLMLFDIEGKTTEYVDDCWRILAAWDRGVVFVTGAKQRKVAFLVLE